MRPLLPVAGQAGSDAQPEPVLLMPRLPELPQEGAARRAEPSPNALGFMGWLQQGLASREIKRIGRAGAFHRRRHGAGFAADLQAVRARLAPELRPTPWAYRSSAK